MEQKYYLIRRSSRKEINKVPLLKSLLRNNVLTRLHRHCFLTGRPRENYRDFGLSEHILGEMVNASLLPGATRSSW
ncbi:hypothetical protein AAHE18_14G109900 [Arachis hypogaea]